MPVIRLCGILLFFALVAGCSSTPEYQPIEPDTGLLMAAEQALAEANTPQAEKFAPRALDWARQRLSLARDIVYIAAREGRALDDAERARVQRLVESAQLDARLAIIRSRALAASAELAEARQT
ncbi:MAG: hypothetical protein L0H23_02455, partial [Luteimonas sp.]|nr:hypothetical protein [Luteimonas sp.]